MRLRAFLVFLALLVPSALYVWRNRDVPEFGRLHDDGLLFVSAKSLAQGDGFKIISLPEQPAQTKYPILYPLFMSLAWKLNPHFPDNLWIARLLCWTLLVICLALFWIYYRREGFSETRTMLLIGLLAVNPYMILFGSNTFSEVFFMCWLGACFLLAEGEGIEWAILAGMAGGCAYLSRTAGIGLLISMPAWYLMRKQGRRAIAFVAGMLPFVIGWMVWSRASILHTSDQTLIYYTDYMKYEFLTIGLDNFHIVLWKNMDGLLYGMGGLALPEIFKLLPVKILTQVVGVAMISGTVRLYRQGIGRQYSLFAIVSSAMLIVWHFPPNERFVLPIFPLLLAGLIAEVEHIAKMLLAAFRKNDWGQRIVAGGMASVVTAVLLAGVGVQMFMSFNYLYVSADRYRAKLSDLRGAYSWIAANVPDSAKVLSNDDPVLYLYSGRRGHVVPLVPRSWYVEDHESTVNAYRDIANYCRSHGFEYFYSNTDDTGRWTDDPLEEQAVRKAVHENPELTPLFEHGFGTVYRVGPPVTATRTATPSADQRATP